jgi:hypothetical protein
MASGIPQWGEKVRSVSVVFGQEVFNDIPLKVSAYNIGALLMDPVFPVCGKP